jgi:hypothetical protein
MSNKDDEKAVLLIEKAVYKARDVLMEEPTFRPFLLLLNEAGEEEFYSNEVSDMLESYALLEDKVEERILEGGVDILLLVCKAGIPAKFVVSASDSIRIHIEEKSQLEVKVGARFFYVPYKQRVNANKKLSVLLEAPLPVGFVAQYIVK